MYKLDEIAALEAENVKLRAERDEARLKLTNFGSTVLYALRSKPHSEIELEHAAEAWERDAAMYRERAERAEAEVARLTEALKPFAKEAYDYDGNGRPAPDEAFFVSDDGTNLTVRDFRRARDTLAALKGSTDAQA